MTPHPCTTVGQHRCEGDACGGTYSESRYAGTCDPDGCDFNSYRQGVKDFYGPGMTVDTKTKMTVVTQFIKGSGGDLEAIRRFYVQNGKVIPNSESTISGTSGNQLDDTFCKAQKIAFGDDDHFTQKGGFKQFSKAVSGPMVLVMSLWDDVSLLILFFLLLLLLFLTPLCSVSPHSNLNSPLFFPLLTLHHNLAQGSPSILT